MSDLNAELVLYRLDQQDRKLQAIEGKLDKVLTEHEARIDSLEHYRTGQKSRNAVFTAIGVPLLGLSLRDLWLLWFGR